MKKVLVSLSLVVCFAVIGLVLPTIAANPFGQKFSSQMGKIKPKIPSYYTEAQIQAQLESELNDIEEKFNGYVSAVDAKKYPKGVKGAFEVGVYFGEFFYQLNYINPINKAIKDKKTALMSKIWHKMDEITNMVYDGYITFN